MPQNPELQKFWRIVENYLQIFVICILPDINPSNIGPGCWLLLSYLNNWDNFDQNLVLGLQDQLEHGTTDQNNVWPKFPSLIG